MLAILAALVAALAFILGGLQAHTNSWFDTQDLIALAVALIALHLAGIGPRRQ